MLIRYDTDAMRELAQALAGTSQGLESVFQTLAGVDGSGLPDPVATQLAAMAPGGRYLAQGLSGEASQASATLLQYAAVYEELSASDVRSFQQTEP